MTQITPLQVKSKLQSAHLKTPHFHTEIKVSDANNQTLSLAVSSPEVVRSLIAFMDMGAVLGGAACHYGGPAALAEIWSVAHAIMFDEANKQNKPWTDLFHFVNDAGHCENGLYAIKANYEMAGLNFESLKTFRAMGSPLTGHGESHLFPEGVYLSNGPLGSSMPQTQGLALAEKLVGTNRVTVCTLSDGAAMEGEAKEAMAAIPGLASKNLLAPYVLIVSDNNTKLSGRIDKDAYSLKPTFEALTTLGWNVIKLEKGNDLKACAEAFVKALAEARKNPTKPVAIWAHTVKGIGSQKTEESSSGAHGFPCKNVAELKDFVGEIMSASSLAADNQWLNLSKNWIAYLENTEQEVKKSAVKDNGEKIQKGIAKALIKAAEKGYPVASVTSDLPGSTGVADFRKAFPHLSFDVGVAESNMISTAAGLAKQGFIPVVDTFAQFGVTKGALPLTMASLSQAPVIAIFSHTGFQDAADGASHQALSYMSMLATIPHVDLYSLSCSEEAEAVLNQVIENYKKQMDQGKTPHSSILFLGRENFPSSFANASVGSSVNESDKKYILAEPQVLKADLVGSKNVLLVTTGSLVGQALKASDILKQQSVGSVVINLNSLNRINLDTLKKYLDKCEGRMVTAEDHQVLLGMGSWLTHQLVLSGESLFLKSLGVQGEFGQSAYTAEELYQKHGLDARSIADAALSLLR